jgi:hypothetical protein
MRWEYVDDDVNKSIDVVRNPTGVQTLAEVPNGIPGPARSTATPCTTTTSPRRYSWRCAGPTVLGVSPYTTQEDLRHIFAKVGVASRGVASRGELVAALFFGRG